MVAATLPETADYMTSPAASAFCIRAYRDALPNPVKSPRTFPPFSPRIKERAR